MDSLKTLGSLGADCDRSGRPSKQLSTQDGWTKDRLLRRIDQVDPLRTGTPRRGRISRLYFRSHAAASPSRPARFDSHGLRDSECTYGVSRSDHMDGDGAVLIFESPVDQRCATGYAGHVVTDV
jgi:hypothetical protein